MIERIKALSAKFYPQIRALREQIHAEPELSFEEFNTAKKVCEILQKAGISFQSGVAKTGIVAQIVGTKKGSNAQKCVLLRADMDALPVDEKSGVSYASKVAGKMHACGHDGHTAALVGAALILNELKSEFSGVVKFMFQPAEENYGGAEPMIRAGVLENPRVDAVFGFHLWGSVQENKVQISSGAVMAGVDSFDLEFIGKGGHGAHPHTAIDPVVMAAKFITDAQTLVSRRLKPVDAGVVTIGAINAGTTYNIIPQNATLKGTVRFLNDKTQKILQKGIEQIAKAVASEFSGKFKLQYTREYPPLINDKAMSALAQRAFAKVLGDKHVIKEAAADMGAEDFAFLARARKGAYVFLGISKDLKNPTLHHSPNFCWDTQNLNALMQGEAAVALEFLGTTIYL